jgi:hypothetical protein
MKNGKRRYFLSAGSESNEFLIFLSLIREQTWPGGLYQHSREQQGTPDIPQRHSY